MNHRIRQQQFNVKTMFRSGLLSIFVAIAALAGVAAVDVGSHSYQGFTAAYREIEVAVAESGRVASINVQRGTIVKKGQLLYELETDILEASRKVAQSRATAKARIEALKVEQEIKQRRFDNVRSLASDRAATPDELHRADGDLRVARLNVEAALEQQQEAALEVREIEARIESRRSRSPVSGVVTDVRRDVGEFVSTNDPHVATVVDLSKLRITFYLPTRDATQLEVSQSVSIATQNADIDGVVEYVGPVTEAESGRVRTDVVIDNSNNRYRAGMLCTIDRSSFKSPASGTSASKTASDPHRTTSRGGIR